jgi:hypothetical protein
MFNPADLKNITGHTTHRGVSHNARGDIREEPIQPRENFRLTATGRNKKLVSQLGFRISVPIVAALADLIPLLQTYQNARFGRVMGPEMLRVSALNLATNVITIEDHGISTATEVMVAVDEAAPTLASGSLSTSTLYYFRAADADTGTLHPTANDATNNTNPIDFSAAGTGDWWICVQRTLTLHRNTGVKRTYRNVIVERFPTLVAGGGKLIMTGDLVFRALPGWGYSPDGTDTVPFYSEANEAYTPPAWSSGATLTGPALTDAAWGASAPWSGIRSEGGWQFEFAPTLSDLDDGVWPAGAMILDEFAVTAKGRPLGITKPQYDAAMAEDLGALVTGDDLEVTFAGYTLTLKEAILDPAATIFSPTNRMVSELTWTAHGAGGTDMAPPFTIAEA